MENPRPQSAREMLNALVGFITPTQEEILAMQQEEINDELEADGINVNETVERLLKVVQRNQSKSVLLLAKAERERKLEEIKNILAGLIEQADITKEDLQSELKRRFKFDNAQCSVFCRKFDKASNEDVRTLIEDLELLSLFVENEND